MDADEVLSQFTIPTSCSMDWNRMRGDDRKRFCEACGKHVHNLTAMGPDEIVSMMVPLGEQGGEICGRVFQHPDGTLVYSDRQIGLPPRKGWQFSIRSLMKWVAIAAAWCGVMKWVLLQPVIVAGGIRSRTSSVAPVPGNPSSCPAQAEDLDSESPGETAPLDECAGPGASESDRGDPPGR